RVASTLRRRQGKASYLRAGFWIAAAETDATRGDRKIAHRKLPAYSLKVIHGRFFFLLLPLFNEMLHRKYFY
ncbi:MAG: hypothetical protein LBP98_00175, partial [Tannerella sp.]|nr:hypothetical protein [Tannerella sp.]